MEERKVGKQERENFSLCGPLYLRAVDWGNPHHRRSVAASLVQGVYVLERDRQENRQGHEAQASPWWNFFQFQLSEKLIDDDDSSIFGAIYKYHLFGFDYNAPKYVIAFRGTVFKPGSRARDLKQNFMCFINRLHQSSRFQLAMQAVQKINSLVGPASVWLTGHSLGSAIALLAGKNMTKMGYLMETYLFNPPFLSAPIEQLFNNEKVKHGIRFASSVAKAGFDIARKGQNQSSQAAESFFALSNWVPGLFVNRDDYICSAYIEYFERRKKKEKIGGSVISRLATPHSLGSMIFGDGDSEALHLLPSARLTINSSHCPDFKRAHGIHQWGDFKRAHGIHQWWDPNFEGQSELHMFR